MNNGMNATTMTAASVSHAGTSEPSRTGAAAAAAVTLPTGLTGASAASGGTDGDASIDGNDDAGDVRPGA